MSPACQALLAYPYRFCTPNSLMNDNYLLHKVGVSAP
jgi:hypothetical protein